MIAARNGWWVLGVMFAVWMQPAAAEPYLAVRQELKCNGCHVNPTGGGLRNAFGAAYSQNVLPARPRTDGVNWNGMIADLVALGGNLRSGWTETRVPNQDESRRFALEQFRLYGHLDLISGKVGLYLDQQLAPGSARIQEAYVRYGDVGSGWYLRGGQFYLPFGWRLQDNTAFVRQVSGVSMATPDTGVELGFENAEWSAQLAVTQGAANVQQDSGVQATAQAVWLRSRWRFGAAVSFTDSDLGDRRMGGVFAGLHTGPVAWLGEIDLVRDEGFLPQTRDLLAGLAEMNWTIRQGHNLKLTAEVFDPDRDVSEDRQNRYSLVYEVTPVAFVQVRIGHRRYDGIPQNDLQNRRFSFIELHGFF